MHTSAIRAKRNLRVFPPKPRLKIQYIVGSKYPYSRANGGSGNGGSSDSKLTGNYKFEVG